MTEINFNGKLRMQVADDNEDVVTDSYDCLIGYPYHVPRVFIEGHGTFYCPQCPINQSKDLVIMARDEFVVEYTKTTYFEQLAEDEHGNIFWLDGRNEMDEDLWGGKFLHEIRESNEYSIVEYNLKTLEKKKYTVICEESTEFDALDVTRIMEFYGEEEFCRDFTIKDRKVQRRVSNVEDNYQN